MFSYLTLQRSLNLGGLLSSPGMLRPQLPGLLDSLLLLGLLHPSAGLHRLRGDGVPGPAPPTMLLPSHVSSEPLRMAKGEILLSQFQLN